MTTITISVLVLFLIAVLVCMYYLMKMAKMLDEDNAQANQFADELIEELHKNDKL